MYCTKLQPCAVVRGRVAIALATLGVSTAFPATAYMSPRRFMGSAPIESCARCHELEMQLEQRDALIKCLLESPSPAAGHSSSPTPPATKTDGTTKVNSVARVVHDDAELEAAIRDPSCSAIALLPHQRYCIWAQPLVVTRKSLLLYGNDSTVECSLVLKHSTLLARGIHFMGSDDGRSMPIIDAGFDSRVMLDSCTLRNGREGVYLGNGSMATLADTIISDNIRGIFEGIQCRLTLKRCTFRRNLFHTVLLGVAELSPHRRAEMLCRSVEENGGGNVMETDGSRADFVFSYNPVADEYTDCLREGRPVLLTGEESTANLCDPVW
mmetsp:Transcript_9368/g.10538  ORF Transcript_9368/g.10538 Transcript_9368/m.10538 type:complete len:325 (-) Transcript_9368:61-1035(-)